MNYQDNFINLTPSRTDAFRDKLYLVICILFSCKVGCGALDIFGGYLGVDLISVLILIGAWLIYSSAKKNQYPLQKNGFSLVYGSFKATYIILWVVCGLLVLCALLMLLLIFLIDSLSSATADRIFDALQGDEMLRIQSLIHLEITEFSLQFILVLALIALVIAIPVTIVINNAFIKKLYRAANHLRNSLTSTEPIRYIHSLRKWFIILAAFSALSIISFNLFGSLSSACSVAIYIILFIWTGKYFDPKSSSYLYSTESDTHGEKEDGWNDKTTYI